MLRPMGLTVAVTGPTGEMRAPVVMDTAKAKSLLDWAPTYTSADTLAALARSA